EGGGRVGKIDRLHAPAELRPRREAVLARDDELGLGEDATRVGEDAPHPLGGLGGAGAELGEEVLGLLLQLLDAGVGGKLLLCRHDTPLTMARCPRAGPKRGWFGSTFALEVSSALPADRRSPRRPGERIPNPARRRTQIG